MLDDQREGFIIILVLQVGFLLYIDRNMILLEEGGGRRTEFTNLLVTSPTIKDTYIYTQKKKNQ